MQEASQVATSYDGWKRAGSCLSRRQVPQLKESCRRPVATLSILQSESWPGNSAQPARPFSMQWRRLPARLSGRISRMSCNPMPVMALLRAFNVSGHLFGRNLHHDQTTRKETGGNVSLVTRRPSVNTVTSTYARPDRQQRNLKCRQNAKSKMTGTWNHRATTSC